LPERGSAAGAGPHPLSRVSAAGPGRDALSSPPLGPGHAPWSYLARERISRREKEGARDQREKR